MTAIWVLGQVLRLLINPYRQVKYFTCLFFFQPQCYFTLISHVVFATKTAIFATMKIFAFILAVLVLALSCMPCTDGANAMNNSDAKTEFSKSGKQQEHKDLDDCSPFCTCSCCTGFTFLFIPYQINYLIPQSAEKTAFLLPSKISDIALPVWQPPQLS